VNDGNSEPAFPGTQDNGLNSGCPGMTLRDYFAAKAMQAQVTTDMVPGHACNALLDAAQKYDQDPVYRLALNSYEVADAMLKARAAQ
jgi:hypothetical protein